MQEIIVVISSPRLHRRAMWYLLKSCCSPLNLELIAPQHLKFHSAFGTTYPTDRYPYDLSFSMHNKENYSHNTLTKGFCSCVTIFSLDCKTSIAFHTQLVPALAQLDHNSIHPTLNSRLNPFSIVGLLTH